MTQPASMTIELDLRMIVSTGLLLSGDRFHWGPRLELVQGHRRPGGAFDWDVTSVNQHHEPVANGTVFGHNLQREPLLCLAARGAWALWNDHAPLIETEQYTGLVIEVSYAEDVISFIRVSVDARGSSYTGESAGGFSLSLKTFDCLRRRDVGHWIRSVLNEVAFGDVRPSPQVARGGEPRRLPACWRRNDKLRLDSLLIT